MRVHTPIFERVGTASGDFADDRCAFQRLKIIGERLGGRESALAGQDIERLRVAAPARPGRRGRDVSRRLAPRAIETAAEGRPFQPKRVVEGQSVSARVHPVGRRFFKLTKAYMT